jgi:hypothetical protein
VQEREAGSAGAGGQGVQEREAGVQEREATECRSGRPRSAGAGGQGDNGSQKRSNGANGGNGSSFAGLGIRRGAGRNGRLEEGRDPAEHASPLVERVLVCSA